MRTRQERKTQKRDASIPRGRNVCSIPDERPAHTRFFDQHEGTLPELIDETHLEILNAALAFVFVLLRQAGQQFHEEGDAGRLAAFTAMGALWRFAALFQRPYAERLHVPIVSLMNALQALDNNSVLPIVRPPRCGGRAPSNHVYLALKGHAVAAVRRLINSGLNEEEAHKSVARELQKLGVRPARGAGQLTATTVRNWCKEVLSDKNRKGTSATIHETTLTDAAE
jgi:hypothetical protein